MDYSDIHTGLQDRGVQRIHHCQNRSVGLSCELVRRSIFICTVVLIILSRPSLLTDLTLVIDSNLKTRYSSPTVDPRVTLMLRRSIKILGETLEELTNKKMLAGVKTMTNVSIFIIIRWLQ